MNFRNTIMCHEIIKLVPVLYCRVGTLCGRCQDGYSESLFSTECLSNDECSLKSLFWLIIGGYGLLYCLFFVFESEWSLIVRGFSSWMWSKCCCRRGARNTQQEVNPFRQAVSMEEEKEPGAYMTIFMYYVQVPALLKISILYNNGRDEPLKEIQSNIACIFSFDSFGVSFNTCLFESVTPVTKIALRSGFIGYLFGTLLLLLIIGLIMRLFSGFGKGKEQKSPGHGRTPPNPTKNEPVGCWPSSIPIGSRFIGAFVALILYTYEYISENGFSLLKCVHIKSLDQNVMFIDGNEKCYQEWQYIVIAFVMVYVLPMFAVVAIAPILLRERKIKVAIFVFSLIFPLLALPVLIVMFAGHRKELTKSISDKNHKKDGAVQTVVNLIAEPYKLNELGGLCWEGVIILRRLILVAIATLINSIITRHILLVIACLISMIAHNRIKPFTRKSCNVLESVSLLILLGVALMNLVKGVYFDSGEVPLGVADTIFLVYDYLEVLLVSIIPSCVLLFILLCILIRLIALPFEHCKKSKDQNCTIQNGFRQFPATPYQHGQNDDVNRADFSYNANQTGFNAPQRNIRYYGQTSDPSMSEAGQYSTQQNEMTSSSSYWPQGRYGHSDRGQDHNKRWNFVINYPQYTCQSQPPHHQNQNRRYSNYQSPLQQQSYQKNSNSNNSSSCWPYSILPYYGQHYHYDRGTHWGSQQPYRHNPRRPSSGEWGYRR